MRLMNRVLKSIAGILFGALLFSFSVRMFIMPNRFISGGITGFSLMLHYAANVPVSVFIYGFNIPVVVLGARQVGKAFAFYSIFGITILAVALHVLKFIDLPVVTTDPMLAAVFAGALNGIGGGIVFKSGGTLGGTDIIGIIARKKYDISIGSFLLYSNILVMGISLFYLSPEKIMYTLISIFIASRVTDVVQEGFNIKTTVMIISNKYEEIAETIMSSMNRGVTYLNAEGGYSHKQKKVVICIITRFELSRLKMTVNSIDSDAFISISETREVMGKGF